MVDIARQGDIGTRIVDPVDQYAAKVTSDGDLKVRTRDVFSTYETHISANYTSTPLTKNVYTSLLNYTGIGVVDEIHINTNSSNIQIYLDVDGNVIMNDIYASSFTNIGLNVSAGVTTKRIETKSGTDLHYIIPIYFKISVDLKIIERVKANKDLLGSFVQWRHA